MNKLKTGAIIAPMVAEKEPTLRAIVLLAGIAQPGCNALYFQLKNQIEHNAKLTPEMRDSQIAEIPKKIDAMMAADPWMTSIHRTGREMRSQKREHGCPRVRSPMLP
jgi:hypothetical protein